MTFIERYMPKKITDLTFHDAAVANIITDYANGLRDKHLILHGPPGSGKSIAAQMILGVRMGDLAGTAIGCPIHPRTYQFDDFSPLTKDWSMQMMNGNARGYTVIDEVDFFSERMQERLRAFIDNTNLGTIITTTNNLDKLDNPLKDRCRAVYVERPAAQDWTLRVQAILMSEGFNVTTQQVIDFLDGFEGSARKLMEFLEDLVISLRHQQLLPGPSMMPRFSPKRDMLLVNGRTLRR